MGFFDRGDPLERRAQELVPLAHKVAEQAAMLRHIAVGVGETDEKRWRFCVTVAVVFVAATRLRNLGLGHERESRLMEIVARDLQSWRPRAYDAFEDCKAFFDRTYDVVDAAAVGKEEKASVSSDVVGTWIVWNILGRQPESATEKDLVRTLGVGVTVPAFRAWDPKKAATPL